MLNGIDPIIIFQFSKSFRETSELLARIPLISQIPIVVDSPPIPIYLSENLTGLFIQSQSKTLDSETSVETKTNGTVPDSYQKGIGNIVTVDMVASRNSIGLTLLLALADLAYEKLTSKEYFITYLNGAITVFRGELHNIAVSEESTSDLRRIKFEISRGGAKTPKKPPGTPVVPGADGTTPFDGGTIGGGPMPIDPGLV